MLSSERLSVFSSPFSTNVLSVLYTVAREMYGNRRRTRFQTRSADGCSSVRRTYSATATRCAEGWMPWSRRRSATSMTVVRLSLNQDDVKRVPVPSPRRAGRGWREAPGEGPSGHRQARYGSPSQVRGEVRDTPHPPFGHLLPASGEKGLKLTTAPARQRSAYAAPSQARAL